MASLLPADHQHKWGQTVFYTYLVPAGTEQWKAGKKRNHRRQNRM